MKIKSYSLVGTLFTLILSPIAVAQLDLSAMQDETVTLVQEYLRVDTVNPPGNETNGVNYFAALLDKEGIPYETAESAPGRGNIWARLEGGDEPALVLLHHMDVVPADESYWDHPPLAGVIDDGKLYGRGALDTKSLGILHLQAFIALHRDGKPLKRDVIFMGTADEEAGGLFGAGWMVENRREVFDGVGMLLNEGGSGTSYGDQIVFSVEVAQKVPFWLRMEATDTPGHGSSPRVSSATTRLIKALSSIQGHQSVPRIVPSVESYFSALASLQTDEWKDIYENISEKIQSSEVQLKLQLHNPGHHALTRNTCSITRLEGSSKINVVSPTAAAEIDCRLLPDQDRDEFLEELRSVINDNHITIEPLLAFTAATSSSDTELFRTIAETIKAYRPDAVVFPSVATGFTDSHFFRDIGIDSYGFGPFLVPQSDRSGVHGNNERVSTENLKDGFSIMWDVVREIAQ
jgi:acetylornithine deacetylase/succinyl-diaminopimelate desuccinylase-like protein